MVLGGRLPARVYGGASMTARELAEMIDCFAACPNGCNGYDKPECDECGGGPEDSIACWEQLIKEVEHEQ